MLFASKWHFLSADVLFGVHRSGGHLLLGTDAQQAPLFVCWTDQARAEKEVHPDYALKHAVMRNVLPSLPHGTSVWVDPGTETMTVVPGPDADAWKALCFPFPANTSVQLGTVPVLPPGLKEAIRGVCRSHHFIERVWVFLYRIDNGPTWACVAFDGPTGPEATDDAGALLSGALDVIAGSELASELGQVPIMAYGDLPDAVRSWVGNLTPITA